MNMNTPALVLRETAYKEADKILTVLTPEFGKMTVSARGCRRKNSKLAAPAQLLVYSEMTLYEFQGRWNLREAADEHMFWTVRQDVDKLALASYFAEVAEQVSPEGMEAAELLRLLLNSLYALDQMDKPMELVKAAFELKLMALSGYEPMLEGCAVCGKKTREGLFHLREGVLCCRDCRCHMGEGVAMPFSSACLTAMEHIVGGDPKRLFSFRLDGGSMGQLEHLAEAFLLTQLERGFKTLDFYKMLRPKGVGAN